MNILPRNRYKRIALALIILSYLLTGLYIVKGPTFIALLMLIIPVMITARYVFSFRHHINASSGDDESHGTRLEVVNSLLIMGIPQLVMVALLLDAFGIKFELGKIAMVTCGVAIVISSNYMGKVPLDSWAGFKNRWTLGSPAVWWKTHRLMGRIGVAFGLIVSLVGLMVKMEIATKVIFACVLPMIATFLIVPPLYSRFVFKRLHLVYPGPTGRAR